MVLCPICRKEHLEESEFDEDVGYCSACGSLFEVAKEFRSHIKKKREWV